MPKKKRAYRLKSEKKKKQKLKEETKKAPYVPPVRTGRPRVLDDDKILKLLAWKVADVSVAEAARRLGIAEGTARKYLKEYQLKFIRL